MCLIALASWVIVFALCLLPLLCDRWVPIPCSHMQNNVGNTLTRGGMPDAGKNHPSLSCSKLRIAVSNCSLRHNRRVRTVLLSKDTGVYRLRAGVKSRCQRSQTAVTRYKDNCVRTVRARADLTASSALCATIDRCVALVNWSDEFSNRLANIKVFGQLFVFNALLLFAFETNPY